MTGKGGNTTSLSLFCQDEKCNGMLGDNSICMSCHKEYCSKCNVKLETEHVCNPDDIKSFELVKSKTKSCPKCLIPIHKINGCDQMFCTECHTPFSWNTGKIIEKTSFFHNPHYFDHLNNGGNQIRFGNRGQHRPPFSHNDLEKKCKKNTRDLRLFNELYRLLIEFIDLKCYRFTHDPNKNIERVKFLSNEISREAYLRFLHKEDKKIELLHNIDQAYIRFYNEAFDSFNDFVKNDSICKCKFTTRFKTICDTYKVCIQNIVDDLKSSSKQFYSPIGRLEEYVSSRLLTCKHGWLS